jgi:hypothetical protein
VILAPCVGACGHLVERDSGRGSSGVGGVALGDVRERADDQGDVASGLQVHWCIGHILVRLVEDQYSGKLEALGRDDVSYSKGTGHGGLDVCEILPGIVGSRT